MKSTGLLWLLLLLFFVVSCGESNKNNKGIAGRTNIQSNPASASPADNGGTNTNTAPTGLPSGTSGTTERYDMLQFTKNCVITVANIDLTTNPDTPKLTITDKDGNENTITVPKINDNDATARNEVSNGVKVGEVSDSGNKAVYVILSKANTTPWARAYQKDSLVIRFVADGLDPQIQFDVAAELKTNIPLQFKYESNKYCL